MVITKTSSTSDRRRSPLSFAPWLALGLLVGITGVADARRPKQDHNPAHVVEPAPTPPPPAPRAPSIPLFPDALPLTVGPVVEGLANNTAQACAACHFDSHSAWADSRHATGWRSPVFQRAVAEAGTPACTSCHLPFLEQSGELVAYDDGDINKPLTGTNPAFDASLRMEGITCATCHIRQGEVVAARPIEDIGPAPHPLTWSEDLASDAVCATCHQLTWEGANSAFYDTYGEWKASPYAAAGVGCQDCHGGAGAGAAGFEHGMNARLGSGLSILLDLDSPTLVRGDDPVRLGLRLQNTGAGHAYPTGSPFTGVQVRVRLVGPPDRRGKITETTALEHDLRRITTEGPPWDVTEDTRVPAGGQIELETELSVPYNAPDGSWSLHVDLLKTVGGKPLDRAPLSSRILPLAVE